MSLSEAPGKSFFEALYTLSGSALVAFSMTDKKLFFDFYYHWNSKKSYLSEKSSPSDVVHVFQPFEVTDGDTTCVTKDVWQELDSSWEKNLFGFDGCGSVGGFNNQLAVELVGVVLVDWLFEGGWDEDVAELVKKVTIPCRWRIRQWNIGRVDRLGRNRWFCSFPFWRRAIRLGWYLVRGRCFRRLKRHRSRGRPLGRRTWRASIRRYRNLGGWISFPSIRWWLPTSRLGERSTRFPLHSSKLPNRLTRFCLWYPCARWPFRL